MSKTPERVQDPVSALIRAQGLAIKGVFPIKEADLLIILLTGNQRLEVALSDHKLLMKASQAQLEKFELLPDGAGVHWPALDEHLSLRGFLLAKMRSLLAPGPTGLRAKRKPLRRTGRTA